jgi:inosine-uridine nucleoside N-ribohydrolase
VALNPVIFDPATGERELVRIAALSGNGFRVLGIKAAAGTCSMKKMMPVPRQVLSRCSAMHSGRGDSEPIHR